MEEIRPMVKAIIVVIRHSAIETSVTQIQQKDVTRKSHKNLLTNVYNGDILRYEMYNT